MITPKIEALHILIQWLNSRTSNIILPKLDLDKSSLGSNACLSGFIDSDGNFYSQFIRNSKGICNNIKYYMRITQRQTYHKIDLVFSNSYFYIMDEIKKFLLVSNITIINRDKINYIESAYEIRTVKRESCSILIRYLNNYPLFSSKHLDFLAWSQINEINTKKQYKELKYSDLLFTLKNSMNDKRVEFNWNHLNYFYFFS
uniref:LAGLIDADG endonuclease type 1 n=1 Tax=Amanita thiersii TaxID=235537 RepID=A0A5Q0N2G9_9AGAR|nr:LAGLIDADG endonuclease type 1 [Amanita thiersii]QFZ98693.1 LAGLIDADG endonuclease type 1 [Amanita thiersii]